MPMLGSRAAAALKNWGFTRILSTVLARLTDQYYKYTTLLIRAKNGSPEVNTTTATAAVGFNSDSSATLAQLNINGDVKPTSRSPYTVGFYSNYFNASTDFITAGAAYPGSTVTSFTIECWIYMTANPVSGSNIPGLVGDMNTSGTTNYSSFGPIAARTLTLYWFPGAQTFCNGSTVMNLFRWYHIAISVNANVIKMFIDGVAETLSGTTTLTNRSGTTSGTTIGTYSTSYFLGYISNLRIISGYGLYNANFTPPVAPLDILPGTTLLTCNSFTLEDRGPIRYALTKGGNTTVNAAHPFTPVYTSSPSNVSYSVYFDGSGDYLSIPNNNAFNFGTSDFTIEFWLYSPVVWTSQPSSCGIVGQKAGDATNGWVIYRDGGFADKLNFRLTLTNNFPTVTSPPAGQWSHWAVTRSGTTVRWFYNGIVDTSTTSSANVNDSTGTFYVGFSQTWSGYYNGYISNLRIVNGTALYTSTFTPSTTPLTAVTNTQVLMCRDAVFKDNSSNAFIITSAGDAKVAKFHPFTQYTTATLPATYSTYFDGTGDYLYVQSQPGFGFSGDFTVEAWVYQMARNTNAQIAGPHLYGVSADWLWVINASGNLFLQLSSSGAGAQTSTSTVPLSAWTHVAVVRLSGTVTFYINGVAAGSGSYATSVTNASTALAIGASTNVNAASTFTGYISNLRIVNGKAVYTGAFTPSTAPLTVTQTAGTNIAALTNTIPANGYSVRFDGSGDTLVLPYDASYAGFGTSNFTIECWVYMVSFGNGFPVFLTWDGGAGSARFSLAMSSTGPGSDTYLGFGLTATTIVSVTPSLNTWYHIAVVRNGSTFTWYQGGVAISTATSSASFAPTGQPIYVGDYPNDFSTGAGYVSNLRVVNGVAVYTSNFTPSTTPLTAIVGTTLLICQGPDFADRGGRNVRIQRNNDVGSVGLSPFGTSDTVLLTCQNSTNTDAAGGNSVFAAGDAKPVSTFNPFLPTTGYDTTLLSSAYFDGSGDYIDVAAGSWQPMGNADFTIEFWVYPTAAPAANWTPFMTMGFSGGAAEIRISQNINATGYGFLVPSNTAATDSYAGYGTMALNQWHHLALVRTGTTVTLYRNGVAAGSLTGLNFNHTANSLFRIGGSQAAYSTDGVYTGYMADLRVVRGLALYRTTFTPPLSPLSATVANPGVTNLLTLQQPGTLYNNFFADTGVDNAVVTRNGSAHAGTFTPFGPGWSMYFDGSSSYVNLQSSAAFAIATSTTPFTIECWIYPLATTGVIISEAYTGSGSIGITFHFNDASGSINTDGPYLMLAYYTGSTWVLAGRSSVAPTLKVWQHVAAVFTGSTTKIFFDGVDVTSSTTPAPITTWPNTGINGDAWYIGRRWDTFANVYFNGYMSNFRFTNGAAVYTAAFTPPTAALTPTAYTTLLTLQDSWLQDRSRYNAQINTVGTPRMSRFNPFGNYAQTPNGYSTYFDGTTNYLTVPSNAAFQLSTGDFTIEFWVYVTSTAKQSFVDMRNGTTNTAGVAIYMELGGVLYLYVSGSNVITGATLSINTWYHIALVRSSGSTRYYLNGTQTGSTYTDSTNYILNSPYIGRFSDFASGYLVGYMSNLRILKGRALYTSAFTPPTSTLTAIAGTSLLTCHTTTVVDTSSNNHTLTNTGTSPVEFNPFGYSTALADTSVTAAGSSMFFNGSTSYLTVPASSTFSIPTNTTPFTIDCWVYITSTSSLSSILSEAFTGGSNTINLYVGLNSGTDLATVGMYPALAYYTGTAWGRAATTTLPIGAGAWYHLAFVFTGSTTKIYVNGRDSTAAGAASTWGGTLSSNGDGPWYIGRRWDTSAPAYFNGYISNFRFVKGVALYSSPFVPARTLQRAPGETLAISSYTTGIVDGTGQNTIETVGDVKINQRTGGPYGTYNSVYFNGSSSLSMALPALAGSNFTLEAWIYLTAYPGNYNGSYAMCMLGTGNGTNGFEWTVNGSPYTVMNFYSKSGGGNGGNLAGSYAFQLNTWYHVATTLSGSTMTHYVNGAIIASATITGWTDVGTAYIGYLPASGYNYWFNGYINNLRVVKGTAVYTSNFTPTIGDLPAVSNTVLLTCRGTRFIDSSPAPLTITPNSLPQVTEFNPFTPNVSNSIYFDGTGDYLVLPFNERLHILQEDFTVECWFNSLSAAANQVLIGQWLQTSGQGGYSLFVDTNRVGFSFGPANEGAALILPATTYVLGTWNHAAIVRSGSTFTLYLNGASTGTATSSTTRAVLSVNTVLGNYYAAAGTVPASGANYYYGYLADVRMSKYARYTATFTPPTAELPATA